MGGHKSKRRKWRKQMKEDEEMRQMDEYCGTSMKDTSERQDVKHMSKKLKKKMSRDKRIPNIATLQHKWFIVSSA